MAQQRKVASLLALAVLATVVQSPMHRYEMASVMRARDKDRDMDIKWGSLYTVVKNLEKNGFVEPIGTSRQGARPETAAGSCAGRPVETFRRNVLTPLPVRTSVVINR